VSVAVVVLDIEGTTSATAAVHEGLYNYARPRLGAWIDDHADDADVAAAVAATKAEAGLPEGATTDDVVAVLQAWMDDDHKAAALKTLQGQIWAAGFDAGELQAHFFPDVPGRLAAWTGDGVAVAVFSSGSVLSQRAWFGNAESGDLSGLVTSWFDTVNAGPKREPASFTTIAEALGVAGERLLFLSDVPAELDAAVAAGWQAIGVQRPGEPAESSDFGAHRIVVSFDEVVP
jgi:enolase-phosphatase E1